MKPVAFEIPLSQENIVTTKKPLNQTLKRSSSDQEIQQKLNSATHRKKIIDESKSIKAGEHVEKVKKVVSLNQQHRNELQKKLKEKLENALQNKDYQQQLLKQKLGQHLSTVEERKQSNHTPKLALEIDNKLNAAEQRRKALVDEKVAKLSKHHKHVVQSKPNNFKIQEKLKAAEQRRRLIEKQQIERLEQHENHAKEVRHRKALAC